MCLSIPMQIVEWQDEEGNFAWVARQSKKELVNMMLLGPQPVGTWLLTSLGLAKEVIDDEQRALIEDALAALAESLDEDYDPTAHFRDLKPVIHG